MLDALEGKWRSLVHCFAPPECTGEVQFFAWNDEEEGEGVVICIGSNYSQYPTTAEPRTKTNLSIWRSNYKHAVNTLGRAPWSGLWREYKWLIGNDPPPKPRFFIMTNLVPWITSRPWTDLSESSTRALIDEFYRHFRHAHLLDLKIMFPTAFVVGHGVDNKTLPYLHRAIGLWDNRMIRANLTYQQTPTGWNTRRQRFKF